MALDPIANFPPQSPCNIRADPHPPCGVCVVGTWCRNGGATWRSTPSPTSTCEMERSYGGSTGGALLRAWFRA